MNDCIFQDILEGKNAVAEKDSGTIFNENTIANCFDKGIKGYASLTKPKTIRTSDRVLQD